MSDSTSSATSHVATAVITARRSVRDNLTGEPIPLGILEEVVLCGLTAPSSKDARPWRLHVVTDRSLLERLADAVDKGEDADTYVPFDPTTGKPWPQYESTVRASSQVLRTASAAIFIENMGVFTRGRATFSSVPRENLVGSLVAYGLEYIGLGAAIENLWIAATALGLDGTFMGDVIIAETEIRQELGIEGDVAGVVALGYSTTGPSFHKPLPDPRGDERAVWH